MKFLEKSRLKFSATFSFFNIQGKVALGIPLSGLMVAVGVRDLQSVHIVVYSCRGASKISKIPGSDPDLRPSAKNDEKLQKITKNFF